MLKVFSSKVERYFFPILSTRDVEKRQFWVSFFSIDFTCDFEKRKFGPFRPTLVMKTFDMCLLTPQGNALLGSQFVLAWVLQTSNLGPSDHRLF